MVGSVVGEAVHCMVSVSSGALLSQPLGGLTQ